MTIWVESAMGDRWWYAGWRLFFRWPRVVSAAKSNSYHGRVTILRGLLTLEEW